MILLWAGCRTVAHIAVAAKLKEFLRLLLATNYVTEIDVSTMGITVFAPTDAAFAKFFSEAGIANEQTVWGNATLSSSILKFHLVPGLKLSEAFATSKKKLKTLLSAADSPCGKSDLNVGGHQEAITLHGGENKAKALSVDNRGCTSIVHIIDTVLLPCPLDSFGL